MKLNLFKILIALPAILMVTMVAGCSGQGQKTVKTGDTVSVDYIGTFTNGTVFDTSIESVAKEAGIYNSQRPYEPLTFTVGGGQMIQGFDKAVVGMEAGESKNITLQPEEAYGQRDPSKVIEVPIQQLQANGIDPEVGMQLITQSGGMAEITAVNESSGNATIDFNHPMAGNTLQFKITVKDIQSK